MRLRTRTIAGHVLLLQVLVVVATLGVGFALALRESRARLDDEFQQRTLAVARAVAATPEIAAGVQAGRPGGDVQRRAEAVRRASGVSFVVVTDRRGIRFSHPVPSRVGRPVSTDPSAALAGRTQLAVETGSLGRSARAKVPLRAPDGRVVGEVSVGWLEPALDQRFGQLVPTLALYSGVALLFGVAASVLLARGIRRRTFGLGLDELAGLLQEREAMLHAVREGVVAVDPDGRVRLLNDEARRLLDLDGDPVGRPLSDVLGAGGLTALAPGVDVAVARGNRLLVVSRMAVRRDGRELGTIMTLRDRTELEALLGELDSVRSLADALRAQAHEHANRLHTLNGLLAYGRVDEARSFLAEIAGGDGQVRDEIADRVGDARLAALLTAKVVVAQERGVRLELDEATDLDADVAGSRDVLTVLGNLVDNAIDAAADGEGTVRVTLTADAGTLVIGVRDSGPGVDPALAETLFEPGVSTKGEGRGTGLATVGQLVARRGGTIDLRMPASGGTAFEVRVPGAVGAVVRA